VVQDSFMSPATAVADVVLPRALFTSKDGTYTNLERRIQRLANRDTDLTDSDTESNALCLIAQKMGYANFSYRNPSEIMDEIASVSPIYSGVSYSKLAQQTFTVFSSGMDNPKPTQLLYSSKEHRGLQWPVLDQESLGTAVLYQESFKAGKAAWITPEFALEGKLTEGSEYSSWLVPGRVLLQSDRDSKLVPGRLNHLVRDELAQIHPSLAKEADVSQGDKIIVETAQGNLTAIVDIDDSVPVGSISITTLFGQLAVELQESEDIDPMSKVVGLNVLPARLVKN